MMDVPQRLEDLMVLLELDISQQASWARRWNSLTSGPPFVQEMKQISKAMLFFRRHPDLVSEMIDWGLMAERVAFQLKAMDVGIGFVDLHRVQIKEFDLAGVSRGLVTQTRSIPVKRDGNTLWVAISAHDDRQTLRLYGETTGFRIVGVLAIPAEIDVAIDKYFPEGG